VRLTLVVLRCADLAKSRAFYEALGLTLEREQHGTGAEHFAATLDGGTVLELYPRRERETSGLRFGLSVPDVDTAVARLAALGAAMKGKVAIDPDGHHVELS
jgi:catechol 2,3-dioxygenase-like lactoylglutathione lyase family enzyme